MGRLRRVRSTELWVIPSHPRQAPPPAHYAPRDGISGGPRGTVSQRPRGVMPAWPFVFYCLTAKIGTLGERPLLARSGPSAFGRSTDDVQEYGSPSGKNPSRKLSTAAFASQIANETRRLDAV